MDSYDNKTIEHYSSSKVTKELPCVNSRLTLKGQASPSNLYLRHGRFRYGSRFTEDHHW